MLKKGFQVLCDNIFEPFFLHLKYFWIILKLIEKVEEEKISLSFVSSVFFENHDASRMNDLLILKRFCENATITNK